MLAAAIKRYPVVRLLIDLRITVVCLSLLFVLTFLGTIHQIDNGIYSAQKKYFESFFASGGPASCRCPGRNSYSGFCS